MWNFFKKCFNKVKECVKKVGNFCHNHSGKIAIAFGVVTAGLFGALGAFGSTVLGVLTLISIVVTPLVVGSYIGKTNEEDKTRVEVKKVTDELEVVQADLQNEKSIHKEYLEKLNAKIEQNAALKAQYEANQQKLKNAEKENEKIILEKKKLEKDNVSQKEQIITLIKTSSVFTDIDHSSDDDSSGVSPVSSDESSDEDDIINVHIKSG